MANEHVHISGSEATPKELEQARETRKKVADKLAEEKAEAERLKDEVKKRLNAKRGVAEKPVDPSPGGYSSNRRSHPTVKDGKQLGRKLYDRAVKGRK